MGKAKPIQKVFLSSTGRDLHEYREAVALAINRLDGFHCVRMEDFGARDRDSDAFCRQKVAECDVYLGLLGALYGAIPPGEEHSYTEREYDVASEAEIPRLVFLAQDFRLPKALWKEAAAHQEQVERFHERVKAERLVGSFEFGEGEPEALAARVTQALANWASQAAKKVPKAAPKKAKPVASAGPDLTEVRRRYLEAVKNLYWLNPFKGLDRKGEHVFPLLDLYVDLKVSQRVSAIQLESETSRRGVRRNAQEFMDEEWQLHIPTTALELLQRNDGLVLLGHPGSGKTTFLKVLALKLASGRFEELGLGPPRLPILVPISDYANALRDGQSLDDYIVASCRKAYGDQPFDRLIKESLDSGQTLLLLDGLDEVRDLALQRDVTTQVRHFYSYWRGTGNKFVLTSRLDGFSDLRFTDAGLAEGQLEDFDSQEIREFVRRWVHAIEMSVRGTSEPVRWLASREEEDLVAAIFDNPALRELAANPLLLTILAIMKRQEVTLPEQRVKLYQRYIDVLLQEWNKVRSLNERPVVSLNAAGLLGVLSPLALWLQQKSAGLGVLRRETLQEWLEDHFRPGQGAGAAEAAGRFLDDLQQTSLLSERGPDRFGFLHRTFQEFLAAREIAKKGQKGIHPIYKEMSYWIGQDAWKEVLRLVVGYVAVVEERPEAVEDLIELLLGAEVAIRREAEILAGESLADLGEIGVRTEVRDKVVRALMSAIRDDANVKAVDRSRAGLSLASLKDPLRPEVTTLAGMQFCWVPPGPFLMASRESNPEFNLVRKTQHQIEIPYGYWISRFPLTVAQFSDYCLRAEVEPVEVARARGQWNAPKLGLSLHEVRILLYWLNVEGGEKFGLAPGWSVTLPSEAEWEKAARGGLEVVDTPMLAALNAIGSPTVPLRKNSAPDRSYPWGEEGDQNFSSALGKGVGAPFGVGCYPSGASPYGCEELSADSWEMTRSVWAEDPGDDSPLYSTEVADLGEDMAIGDKETCVLRGFTCGFRGRSFFDLPERRVRLVVRRS